MIRTLVRRYLIGALGLAAASLVQAQTLEIWAGGATTRDAPADQVPVAPLAVAIGPDGKVHVLDGARNRLIRLDPTTGTATALPGLDAPSPWEPPPPEFNVWDGRGVAVNADNELVVSTSSGLYQADLVSGELIDITEWAGPYGADAHMAFDANGRLYFPKTGTSGIWFREPWGEIRVLAGEYGPGFSGDGGPAQWATLDQPHGVAVDSAGNVYIADTNNHRVRRVSIDTGIIDTVAGTGSPYFNGDGLLATASNIGSPQAVALDAAGNLYIQDSDNARIRRVDAQTGIMTTVAGNGEIGTSGDGGPATNAAIALIWGNIAVDAAGNLYLAEMGGNRLRRVDVATGVIETVLGNGTMTFCAEMSTRRSACLGLPGGLALDENDDLLIADTGNQRLRKVLQSSEDFYTIAGKGYVWPDSGDGGPASDAGFPDLRKLSLDGAGNLYIAGGTGNRVRRIDKATGIISTVAGTGDQGFSGDGGPATEARFSWINHAVVGPDGDLYLSDANNHRVRRVSASTGIVSTIAGNGLTTGPLGDGGAATSASLAQPDTLRFDSQGNLLIGDAGHARIRRVDRATGIITTLAGNGSWASSGNGGPATAAALGRGAANFALDAGGNLYLAGSGALRRIDADTGIIDSVTPPWGLNTPEGKGIQSPEAMEFDSTGRLYIADSDENLVFRVSDLPVEQPDSTPPLIAASVTGAAGDNGWYVGDVQVSWSVTDAESAIGATTGCETRTVVSDTGGVSFTCSATSDGGTATSSVVIKRDATPPALQFGAKTPAADASGWNSGDVSIAFTVSDALSGIAQADASPVVIGGEGTGLVEYVHLRDQAGNSLVVPTAPVNIDRTAPLIQPVVSGPLGTNAWYVGDVQLTWSIDELPASIRGSSGCEPASVTSDTAGVTFTCTVTSAGGVASQSVTVKRDATAPELIFGTPSPVPNSYGWNKTNVSVPFTSSDALSGVANTSSTSPLVIASEGAGVTGTVTVTDAAGNSAEFTTVARNIDKTAPIVEVTSPAQGATYGFYQNVPAEFACVDVSLNTCKGTVADGSPVNTRVAGARTFTVTGKDRVGFTTSVTRNFTVASAFNFEGFLAPASAPPTLNLVARGSLVPVRWQLPDGNGGFVSNPASFASASVGWLSCGNAPAVPLTDTASGAAGISFDAATHSFTYNWQTGSSWTGCRKLTIKLRDKSLHELRFRFQ